MRLINLETELDFFLEENRAHVICVENPKDLLLIAGDLWRQERGDSGAWILSENDKELNIAKEVECIYNPFLLNCNETKVLSKVYKDMTIEAKDNLQEDMWALNAEIVNFLKRLSQYGKYNLDYDLDLDLATLLKAYHVKIQTDADSFAEQIVEYVKVISRIIGKRVFVFLNLKQLLTDEELSNVYIELFNEKAFPILIEGVDRPKRNEEIKLILDEDSCLIEIKN